MADDGKAEHQDNSSESDSEGSENECDEGYVYVATKSRVVSALGDNYIDRGRFDDNSTYEDFVGVFTSKTDMYLSLNNLEERSCECLCSCQCECGNNCVSGGRMKRVQPKDDDNPTYARDPECNCGSDCPAHNIGDNKKEDDIYEPGGLCGKYCRGHDLHLDVPCQGHSFVIYKAKIGSIRSCYDDDTEDNEIIKIIESRRDFLIEMNKWVGNSGESKKSSTKNR